MPPLLSPPVAGDPFVEELETCRQFLLSLANDELPRRLLPKGGASDLVQETLVAGYLGRNQFRGTTLAELRGWLRRILLNELADFARRYDGPTRDVGREVGMTDTVDGDPASATPSLDALVRQEQLVAMAATVDRMPADVREVLHLRLEHGLGFREIAERLGRTEEAVRKAFSRTLASLRTAAVGAAA